MKRAPKMAIILVALATVSVLIPLVLASCFPQAYNLIPLRLRVT